MFSITKISFDLYRSSIHIERFPDEIQVTVSKYGYGNEPWIEVFSFDSYAIPVAIEILSHVSRNDSGEGITEQITEELTQLLSDMGL